MKLYVSVPRGDYLCTYPLLSSGDYQRIDCDGVVILDIQKVHDHRYYLSGFFYARKVILSERVYSSKKELYGAIQKLLEEYL